jgi:hypothetical protein
MAKQRAESDFEDVSVTSSNDHESFTSMTGSDDDKSLPSPAAKLLFDSYAKGKRSAGVWGQRNNEEPDDEVNFVLGDDDDQDL